MWSGVSGLKSQQKAMDVVGNNVANVNTVGFKKSRTEFADVLSQTLNGATSPVENLGGKNPIQIGLGDSVTTVDNVFSQGSLQSTDKITDLAIQGDGFFALSGDGGKTYRYTRAGDFAFDASGNFSNPQGYVVQGWMADNQTHSINSASSIQNIVVPQNMTVPAGITKNLSITANLNGGDTIKEMDNAHGATDANNNSVSPDDMAVLFDVNGSSVNIGKVIAKFSQGSDPITDTDSSGNFNGLYDVDGNKMQLSSGAIFSMDVTTAASGVKHIAVSYGSGNDFNTMGGFASAIKAEASAAGVTVSCALTNDGEIKLQNLNGSAITVGNIQTTGDTNNYFAHALINLEGGEGQSATITNGGSRTGLPLLETPGSVLCMSYDGGKNYDSYIYSAAPTGTNEFKTTEDLRTDMANDIKAAWGGASDVTIDPSSGEFVIDNESGSNQQIGAVYSNNIKFATIMGTLSGLVNSGSKVTSQPFKAAVHSTSIDVYDSLGNKHTVTFEFRKASYDSTTHYSKWDWTAEVPSPATVSNDHGSVKFDETGKLVYLSSPLAITTNWNNGTASQVVNLNFGDIDSFNGLTQFSLPSQTTAQTQDGYAGGSLERLLINQEGVIEGIFSNGKSYPLAQVAMGKFSNNSGLMKEGESMYSETANSGTALIGQAGSGGRGTMAPSHLEMSNVDLATEFTNMILFERGFQANSRSITTSDQMIQELLRLKQ